MNGNLEPSGGLLNSQLSSSKDAVLTTNYLDDYIVRGNVFSVSLAQAFTAGTAIYFTSEISAPDELTAAFLLPIQANPTEGFLILNIYEDTEYTGGTPITPVNRNRNSSNTAKTTVLAGATGATEGTLIYTGVFGSAASGGFFGGSSGGGTGNSANSIVVDMNKKYLYELTNSETATVGINAEFTEI